MNAQTKQEATPAFNTPATTGWSLAKAKKIIGTFAPKGARVYPVIHRTPAGRYRMRLYTISAGSINGAPALTGFDQLITPAIFNAIVEYLAQFDVTIDYSGFWATDGSETAGFGWSEESGLRVNMPIHIAKKLAEIIHGNRDAWELMRAL